MNDIDQIVKMLDKAMMTIAESSQLSQYLAVFIRRFREDLMQQGFTREEAMEIIKSAARYKS